MKLEIEQIDLDNHRSSKAIETFNGTLEEYKKLKLKEIKSDINLDCVSSHSIEDGFIINFYHWHLNKNLRFICKEVL